LLSKHSSEFLNEISLRWRIPHDLRDREIEASQTASEGQEG